MVGLPCTETFSTFDLQPTNALCWYETLCICQFRPLSSPTQTLPTRLE